MTRLIRAASLTHFQEVARQCGLDPWRMLADAGLHRSCLEDPDMRIPAEAVRQLLENSASACGVEAFGLLMAEGRRLSNLGAVGLLAREQPSLRLAMQSLARYGRLHNQTLIQRIEEDKGLAILHFEFLLKAHGPMRQAAELAICVALRMLRMFLGAQWQPRSICFAHSRPKSLTEHRRILGQSPRFSQDFNGIVCTLEDLDSPIPSADPVMADYIRARLNADALSDDHPRVADEVRQMIFILLPRGRCSVEQVASQMGITRRTLGRQLAREGETFTDLLHEVRKELAARYVVDHRRQLTGISDLLGFATLSSFSRWHRQAFGVTAEGSRRSARPSPGSSRAIALRQTPWQA